MSLAGTKDSDVYARIWARWYWVGITTPMIGRSAEVRILPRRPSLSDLAGKGRHDHSHLSTHPQRRPVRAGEGQVDPRWGRKAAGHRAADGLDKLDDMKSPIRLHFDSRAMRSPTPSATASPIGSRAEPRPARSSPTPTIFGRPRRSPGAVECLDEARRLAVRVRLRGPRIEQPPSSGRSQVRILPESPAKAPGSASRSPSRNRTLRPNVTLDRTGRLRCLTKNRLSRSPRTFPDRLSGSRKSRRR